MASTCTTPQQIVLVPGDKPAIRFIKLAEVKALTTLSTSETYRRIAAGTFPNQVVLGPKSVAWVEAEIIQLVNDRITESRAVS